MKCRTCGADIPDNADFCDVCGAQVRRETEEERIVREAKDREKKRRQRLVKKAALPVVIAVLLIAAWNIFWVRDIKYDTDVYTMKDRVSSEEYGKLAEGMTYEQVTGLLGSGAKSSRYGNAFSGFVSYIWPGEYIDKGRVYADVTVCIDLESKKVSSYSEHNVIDGKEVFDNLSGEKRALSEKSIEDVEAICAGMDYEQVKDALGVEGVLTDSVSNSQGNEEKTYEWYYRDGSGYGTGVRICFVKGQVRDIDLF